MHIGSRPIRMCCTAYRITGHLSKISSTSNDHYAGKEVQNYLHFTTRVTCSQVATFAQPILDRLRRRTALCSSC
jgi:hypothetical protein